MFLTAFLFPGGMLVVLILIGVAIVGSARKSPIQHQQEADARARRDRTRHGRARQK